MKLFFEYGKRAVALPALPETLLARASKVELQLLLALTASPALMEDYESGADALAATLSVSRTALDSALSFWIGADLIGREEAEVEGEVAANDKQNQSAAVKAAPKEPTVSVPRRTVTTELPHYTSDALDRVMANRKNSQTLVDEAQKTLGVIFTSHSQIAQLIGIVEGLGVSDEYLLLLLAYCREKGKKTLRYAEKLAVSLVDADVTTPEALSEHLLAMQAAESAEGQIKRLFGFSRSLTGKEKGFVADWTGKFGFDEQMIEKAYEFAVDATANPTLNYINSILVRWHEEGISSPDAADRDRESRRAAKDAADSTKKGKKAQNPATATSFDVDDFFAAAMNRGYGEKPKTDSDN